MNRLLKAMWRFLVRSWYLNRNQAIVKSHKILLHALRARRSIIMELPPERVKEVIENDLVLKEAKNLHENIVEYFNDLGVAI